MDQKPDQSSKNISITSVIAIIAVIVTISLGSSYFLSNREKPIIKRDINYNQPAQVSNSSDPKSILFGRYKGVTTILNSQLKFTSSNLILNSSGRFNLQADSFNLAVFKNEQTLVNGDYPFLYFDIEGVFDISDTTLNLVVDKVTYRFDQEEISLDDQNSVKIKDALKLSGVDLAKLDILPVNITTDFKANNNSLEIKTEENSPIFLQIQTIKI